MKRRVSKSRTKHSWRQGGLAATRYERVFPDARKSTAMEDIHMHIDYWHDDIGVDVKGNNLPDEIWVELKNVQGKPGWVFGEAQYIAFDMPEVHGFVFVKREQLKDYCSNNVDFSSMVTKNEAYKKCYSRRDRDDLITFLTLQDLKEIPSYKVVKYSDEYRHPESGDILSVS